MGILIFISYATKDAELFHIAEIAEKLTQYNEIDDALYWQEDVDGNIITYMNKNLEKCDVILLFCSQNSLNSEPVQMEWTAAVAINKAIMPIFIYAEYIPPILKPLLGIKFDPSNMHKNIIELKKTIIKRIEKQKSEKNRGKDLLQDYHGIPVLNNEYNVIMELEFLIGKTIPIKSVNGHVISLKLNNCKLKSIPESIINLQSLSELDLSFNNLTSLPDNIGNLNSLTKFNLSNNVLKSIPDSIGDLSSLSTLNLSRNRLTSIPNSFFNLKSLSILYLNVNRLKLIPENIWNLHSLTDFDLSWNNLKLNKTTMKILKDYEKKGCKIDLTSHDEPLWSY
ncbi:hypothetical protein LCGC14_1503370 [marine sediment metagenome]|uniref:Uncharacterized protein n=1 Tax=marine sediment metagenome TaxID=412755 RepID=A0A0F9JP86_9ZZZZ